MPRRIYSSAAISGIFLFLDQFLKYLARTHQTFSYYLGTKWLGWEYFANKGVAFSIPLGPMITIALTPIIIMILCIVWYRNRKKQQLFHFGMTFIIFGAISNFIDRVVLGITIDYLRVLTGVINIADAMIVCGVLLMIVSQQKIKKRNLV